MRMQKPDGTFATTDKENADVFEPHYTQVYNRDDAPVDDAPIDDIPQRNVHTQHDHPPTITELDKALAKAENDKVTGESGITARALKALTSVPRQLLLQVFIDFWNGTCDPEEWHHCLLSSVPKSGKDSSHPTNWRGICLQDALARIYSSILNQRLLDIVKNEGIETQFGSQPGRGCQDGLYTLRSALQLRRSHNLPTHALFVDLVKAFDTANHDLLFPLLEKYGVPPKLTSVIRRLYTDTLVKLRIGKELRLIPYTVGVKQGDNMAPVLFLFVMQAFADTLSTPLQAENIDAPEYRYHPHRARPYGRLLSQSTTAKGRTFHLSQLFYVDDGAFLFRSRDDLEKGANVLYAHFARFGLIMHIGSDTDKSKSEAMFFPPDLSPAHDLLVGTTFPIHHGHIHYTDSFRYLGSIITPSLRDDVEVTTRIAKATAQLGAMKDVFRHRSIDLPTKQRLYMSIQIGTVLWGCESWSITADTQRRLEVFHHRAIRWILNINMFEVEAHRITNPAIRHRFCNIPCITDIITRRQLRWIGKLAQMPDTRLPRKFLAAWVPHPRKPGQPQHTLRKTMAHSIRQIIPTLSYEAKLNEWLHWASDRATWNTRINDWWATTKTRLEPHELPAFFTPATPLMSPANPP